MKGNRFSDIFVTFVLVAAQLWPSRAWPIGMDDRTFGQPKERAELAPWDDGSPEMRRYSAVESCAEELKFSTPCKACEEHPVEAGGRPLDELQASAADGIVAATEREFLDRLKEKTLEFQLDHLAFRDGIDLAASGDAWNTIRNADAIGSSMLNVSRECTQPYPAVERIRAATAEQFFQFGPDAADRRKETAQKFDAFFIGGARDSDPKCGKGSQAEMCRSLASRAHRARLADHAIRDLEKDGGIATDLLGDASAKKSRRDLTAAHDANLSRILLADPALNEFVEREPGACRGKPEKSAGKCVRAYEDIGGDEQSRAQYGIRDAGGIERLEREMRQSYQQANRKMKSRVVAAIARTCKSDGSEMILSPDVAQAVLAEMPEMKGMYCRLLKDRLRSQKRDELLDDALQIAGWGAMAGSLVASFLSGGAATPLALGVASSGAFAGRYGKQISEARDEQARTLQAIGARVEDPRGFEAAQRAEEVAKKELKTELKALALSMGLEGAIGAVRKLRAAGKLTVTEEAAAVRIVRKTFDEESKAVARAAKPKKRSFVELIDGMNPVGPPYSTDRARIDKVMARASENLRKDGKPLKFVEGDAALLYYERVYSRFDKRPSWGTYDPNSHTIYLNPKATYQTFLHEIRHAQQYARKATSPTLKALARKENAALPLADRLRQMGYIEEQKIPGGRVVKVLDDLVEADVEAWQAVAYRAVKNEKGAEVVQNRLAKRAARMLNDANELVKLQNAYKAIDPPPTQDIKRLNIVIITYQEVLSRIQSQSKLLPGFEKKFKAAKDAIGLVEIRVPPTPEGAVVAGSAKVRPLPVDLPPLTRARTEPPVLTAPEPLPGVDSPKTDFEIEIEAAIEKLLKEEAEKPGIQNATDPEIDRLIDALGWWRL